MPVVMDHESSMNVNSRFTICRNCEIRERQFCLLFVILSYKLAKFAVISREIAKILGIRHEQDFIL